jgi:hypothetical protein
MVNYNAGQIYKIWSPAHPEEGIYYGSTCQAISNRIGGHRNNYKRYLKGKGNFTTSYNIVKHEDHIYERLCYYPCNSKKELEKKEVEYIKGDCKSCNKVIPGQTKKEWILKNQEKIRKDRIDYYNENKLKESVKHKIYYEKHKEDIRDKKKIYDNKNKGNKNEKDQLRYQKNKEKLKECSKIYYKKNQLKIKEKFHCDCGGKYVSRHKKNHEKTLKHQRWIETLVDAEKYILLERTNGALTYE